MITYFVHSSSRDNELGVRSGWNDPPLSLNGQKQAAQLKVTAGLQNFDAIFCSDLQRAVETARIVFPDADVRMDARLREMNYGELNGRPESAFTDDKNWCIDNTFPAGECCLDVQERVQSFLNSQVPLDSMVAVFAHKYPQLALEVVCNGCTWQEAIRNDWRKTGSWQPGWQYGIRKTGKMSRL